MPWGCIGNSLLGDGSGPGTPNCGLPGAFLVVSALKPEPSSAAYNSKPRKPETST